MVINWRNKTNINSLLVELLLFLSIITFIKSDIETVLYKDGADQQNTSMKMAQKQKQLFVSLKVWLQIILK